MQERFEIIRELCRGKICLDIGMTGDLEHHLRAREKWVYQTVLDVAQSAVGLDLDPRALGVLRSHGYRDLVCGDAEQFAFLRQFEVIVAGEIIEHLSNPGRFLRCCREHLHRDGLLVLTTPNVFSVNNLVKGLLFGEVEFFHEHVNAYTPALLVELLRREGLKVRAEHYFTEKNPGPKNWLFRGLSRARPAWSEGMLIVAVPSPSPHG